MVRRVRAGDTHRSITSSSHRLRPSSSLSAKIESSFDKLLAATTESRFALLRFSDFLTFRKLQSLPALRFVLRPADGARDGARDGAPTSTGSFLANRKESLLMIVNRRQLRVAVASLGRLD
jgi:hypothetical protein